MTTIIQRNSSPLIPRHQSKYLNYNKDALGTFDVVAVARVVGLDGVDGVVVTDN